ncbi:hypothetical protein FBU59_000440 [Linderina macrospora]|uniref:Uncharacterized protein n=1 Tax=Linderina macrospora TaxID=4868 RepID=A0ACC1JH36_9FUNG|nr:hypothetical protein FBU59_000440 [Linderina macrospora]
MSAPNSPNQYIPLGVRASSVPPQPQLPERSPVNTPQPANNSPEEPDIDNIDDGNDSNSNYANEEVMLEEAAEILGFRVAVRRYSQKDLLDATDSLLTFVYIYAFLIDKSLVNIAVRYVASITAMNSRTGFTISVALGIMVLTNVLNIVRHVSMGMSKHGFDSTGVIVDFIGCSSPHLLMVLVVDLFAMFVEFVRIFAYSPLHFSKAHTARFLALILAAERMEDIVDVFAEESSEGNGSEAASPDQTPEAAENDGDQVVLTN